MTVALFASMVIVAYGLSIDTNYVAADETAPNGSLDPASQDATC